MPFVTKDFISITESMISQMQVSQNQVSDFYVGSVARSLLEAPAAELEEFYRQMLFGLLDSIPVAVFESFGFDAISAVSASGPVTFTSLPTRDDDVFVAAGTRLTSISSSLIYVTSLDIVVPPSGGSVEVLSSCETHGSVGNVGAGNISDMVDPINGIALVSNVSPFFNGTDEEGINDRRIRFRKYIANLARSTQHSLEYGAGTVFITDEVDRVTERAVHVVLDEPWRDDPEIPAGIVNLYIHNGSGNTSSDLLQAVTRNVNGWRDSDGTSHPGWKAAGVICNVYAAADESIDVTGSILIHSDYDSSVVIDSAVFQTNTVIWSKGVGQSVFLAEIIDRVMSIPGVLNVQIENHSEDIAVGQFSKAIPELISWGQA